MQFHVVIVAVKDAAERCAVQTSAFFDRRISDEIEVELGTQLAYEPAEPGADVIAIV